jgi:methylenetetrahydrofolate dehydrogenase (NADP+)/methenyltetrahydrofolate cyclohydrolase
MLTIIQVGNDKASTTYVRNKMKAVTAAGMEAKHIALPETATTEDVICKIHQACESTAIIVQLPLPSHIDKQEVLKWIPPWMDVDGLAPHSPYKPLTPCAIMRWLQEKGVQLEGKNVTILGRSELVGKPLANMMIDAGAMVTVCNSKSNVILKDCYCFESDIVISATGVADAVDACMVRPFGRQIFIDVGINRDENGKLCGDISEYARRKITEVGSEYTPVPGGVGKLTVRELVLRLAEMEGAKHDDA